MKPPLQRYLDLWERARTSGHSVLLDRQGSRWRVRVVNGTTMVAQGHADTIDGAAAVALQNWSEPEAA